MASYNPELKSRKNLDGRQTILIRVTQQRKHRRISTGIKILSKNFNPKAKFGSWIRSGEPKHAVYNELLKKMINKLEDEFISVNYSLSSLRQKVSFFKFSKKLQDSYKKEGSIVSAKKLKSATDKLQKYIGDGKELYFQDITTSLIKDYEAHLINTKKNKRNTIHTDLKRLKTCINYAIKEGIINNYVNPFNNFKIRSESTKREGLSIAEIKAIKEKKLETGSKIWHARNYFFFALYTAGMRFGDVCRLKWDNIENDRISYVMHKIKDRKHAYRNIPITKQHEEILGIYKSDKYKAKINHVFPLIDNLLPTASEEEILKQIDSENTKINRSLKTLKDSCEIKKPITFHIARHSFSNIFREIGNGDFLSLSKTMGHSGLPETLKYLNNGDLDISDPIVKAVSDSILQ